MKRKQVGLLILAMLVAAVLLYGFLPRAVPVDLATAEIGPMVVIVEEEGVTRVMNRYTITAPMTGYARRITLKVGNRVGRDEVLAVLEPARSTALDPRARAQARAQVSAADAALAASRESARAAAAEAQFARQELTRSEKLAEGKFLSQSVVDQARTSLSRTEAAQQAAEHQVNVARFGLETARMALARGEALEAGRVAEILRVRAPVSAKVLKVTHESEGTVQAGEPLLEIGDPESLEVEVEVLSTAAVRITPKTRVILDRWGGDQPLTGAVRIVEPAGFTKISALGVEEQRVHVIVDFTSPRELWQRLGDGYRVEAKFVTWEGAEVLQVPTSALFRHNDGWGAYAVQDGCAQLRPVKIGQQTGLKSQILEGIKAGEQVIIHPDDKIKNGVRVQSRT